MPEGWVGRPAESQLFLSSGLKDIFIFPRSTKKKSDPKKNRKKSEKNVKKSIFRKFSEIVPGVWESRGGSGVAVGVMI